MVMTKRLVLLGGLLAIAAQMSAQKQDSSLAVTNPSGEQYQQPGMVADPLLQSDGSTNTQTPGQTTPSSDGTPQSVDPTDEQTKRILWVIPNYRAVSAGTRLPPLSGKEKFVLATQDSFDYSSFILAGMLAGYDQATNSTPEFHQELSGYGRYYWHSFADEAVGNYFTEAIMPAMTHEDPRYYTLGKAGGG